MTSKTKKIIFTFLVLLTLLIITAGLLSYKKIKGYVERSNAQLENIKTLNEVSKKTNQTFKNELPSSAYLKVPFITQAPLETEENWHLHEESCEEAALLQAYLYETDKTMTKEEANKEILQMIAWEKEYFGKHKDLYLEDMQKFITGYYGDKINSSQIKVKQNASIDDIKKHLNEGHPVIVPITGDILNNPYYPYPGYHMLIAIGYTENKIITNDNGTRRGASFSYDTEVFKKAMEDAGGDIIVLTLKRENPSTN